MMSGWTGLSWTWDEVRRPGALFWILTMSGIAIGVGLLVALASVGGGGGAPVASRPKEIEQIYPNPGDQIPGQGEVGAKVPQGSDFALSVDGVGIPDDQLEKIEALGLYKFRPRPGRVIERLNTGEHTARVDVTLPLGGPTISYSWSFRVTA
jgi:hypothetical protein